MEEQFHEMELLSRSLNQAHRAAVQTELNAAGLNEVGHPMLVSILQSAGSPGRRMPGATGYSSPQRAPPQ